MSSPAESGLFQARDPRVADWRRQYYDPGALRAPGSTLGLIVDSLYDLIEGEDIHRTGQVDQGFQKQRYHHKFYEKLGQRFGIRTEVSISAELHKPPADIREAWFTGLYSDSSNGVELYDRGYEIVRRADGVIYMKINESLDGTSAALTHEDPAFVRANPWKDATEYDATVLFDEIQRIRALQAGPNH